MNLKEAIEGYLEAKAERLRNQPKGERVEVIVETPPATEGRISDLAVSWEMFESEEKDLVNTLREGGCAKSR
ncbi:MAG TPA: hypothetical protein VLV18_01585 [Terriglobales bacterium]|nr:hypothetical protein [Terriglobales bacterium]